jgi:hypothetical protein
VRIDSASSLSWRHAADLRFLESARALTRFLEEEGGRDASRVSRVVTVSGGAGSKRPPHSRRKAEGVMGQTSWTTTGVFTGPGGARTDEAGIVTGDLTVHTTWNGRQAVVKVQYSGTSQWFTLTGSPVPCNSRQGSRNLHQAVVEAMRAGGGTTVPHHDRSAPRPAVGTALSTGPENGRRAASRRPAHSPDPGSA